MIKEGYPKLAFLNFYPKEDNKRLIFNGDGKFYVDIPHVAHPGSRDWTQLALNHEEPVAVVNINPYKNATLVNEAEINDARKLSPYKWTDRKYKYEDSEMFYFVPMKALILKIIPKTCLTQWRVKYKSLPVLDKKYFTGVKEWYDENNKCI